MALNRIFKGPVHPLNLQNDGVKTCAQWQHEKGEEYFSYVNDMTIKRFNKILKEYNISPAYYRYEPLKKIVKPFKNIFGLCEMFVKMVVCVIEK